MRLCAAVKKKARYLVIPENGRDMRDNENRVMYIDRESVTLLKGDVERPCLRR